MRASSLNFSSNLVADLKDSLLYLSCIVLIMIRVLLTSTCRLVRGLKRFMYQSLYRAAAYHPAGKLVLPYFSERGFNNEDLTSLMRKTGSSSTRIAEALPHGKLSPAITAVLYRDM